MIFRLWTLRAALLLAVAANPALADDGTFVVWDQNIAAAVSERLAEEARCGANPYSLYGPQCHRQLNLSFDRPILYFTFLDRAALFLYKYHRLNYNQRVWNRTKLKFEVNLKNVYEQEATAWVELRYRFSSGRLGAGQLPGTTLALHQPPAHEN